MQASLHTAELRYANGIVLHTASSGRTTGLKELYLRLVDGEHVGVGEVRINIAYLNGYSDWEVLAQATAALVSIDWNAAPENLLTTMPEWAAGMSMPVRCMIDCALHDLVARRAGMSVAQWLLNDKKAPPAVRYQSNQTLFWSPFDEYMERAESYVAQGFRDLKVRVGVGEISDDIHRIGALRARFGAEVKLAADANARWSPAQAQAHLDALARFDLSYIEQPIPTTRPDDIVQLARTSPIPLMLDEGLASLDDVLALRELGGLAWGHLKLVKLGGLGPTLDAARLLAQAGVPFMIGQMNEGGLATAAALHLACAAQPKYAELYGADGLANDPAPGVHYADGYVSVPTDTGFGIGFDMSRTQTLRSFN